MNERETLDALEYQLMHYQLDHGNLNVTVNLLRHFVSTFRAALASKDAGPQQIATLEGKASLVLVEELARLRAWEKWAREHAKPALDDYFIAIDKGSAHMVVTLSRALAAMPKDSPEGAL